MKKNILKVISVVTAALVLAVGFCFSASADEAEATWTRDSANYTSGKLMDGITAVQGSDRGIITLNTDSTISQTMKFTEGSCIIDLDGHNITVNICGIIIEDGATLKIKDSKGTGVITLKSTDSDCYVFNSKGTLEIQSGKIELNKPDETLAVAVKSSGTLVIGGGDVESVAEIANISAEGGKLQLIGTKGLSHKIGALSVADGTELQLDCAVNSANVNMTPFITAGYSGNEILFVVDESEKAADATTAEGSYKGHTTTAAEVMGISNGIENETLYIILVVAVTVLVLAAAIVLVVIMLKKAKQNK